MNRLVGPIAALAVVLWFAAPFLPGYSIGGAINDRDATTLEEHGSWPSARQDIKDGLHIVSNHSMETAPEGGEKTAPTVEPLIAALKAAQDDATRRTIASALGKMGEMAVPAVVALTTALKAAQDEGTRETIADAINQIAATYHNSIHESDARPDPNFLENLKAAETAAEQGGVRDRTQAVRVLIDHMHEQLQIKPSYLDRMWELAAQHPFYAALLIAFLLLAGGSLLLFAVRPLLFHDLACWAKEAGQIQFGMYKIPVPLHWFVLGWLRNTSRVLDSWVNNHRPIARERFIDKLTVRDRAIHIPMPVILAGEPCAEFTPTRLRASAFGHLPVTLLIWGEGGSGKTSIACQIARWCLSDETKDWPCNHPMLPVLLERELDAPAAADHDPLFDAIRRQVEDVLGLDYPPDDEMMEALLRRRRLLVIVDHLSEMSQTTQERVRPDAPSFKPKALIITSRRRELLGGMTLMELQPMRVAAERLSEFMSAYLRARGMRDQFSDTEFFAACERLTTLVGDRTVTVLCVRLYADQLIEAKKAAEGRGLPGNMPELMLRYVSLMNEAVEDKQRPNSEVQRDAQKVAWTCLDESFRPSEADRSNVLETLGNDAEARLEYLHKRLFLVEVIGVREDRVRFKLDPLAEYLAAMNLIEQLEAQPTKWRRFLKDLGSDVETAREFLLALRDCVRTSSSVPSFVVSGLTNLLEGGPEKKPSRTAGEGSKSQPARHRKPGVHRESAA
jgi:HEAT repeat protein